MPRFVLLYHECPPGYVRASHWDFMLERGEVLRTWAVPRLPQSWRAVWERTAASATHCPAIAEGDAVVADQLGDHRLAYLHEEGVLSGDRGEVRRIDAGTYEGDVTGAGTVEVTLQGELICGRVMLRPMTLSQWDLSVD
jgi:hypothetical protein